MKPVNAMVIKTLEAEAERLNLKSERQIAAGKATQAYAAQVRQTVLDLQDASPGS